MSAPSCLFCAIVSDAMPAYRVWEGATSLAFLDVKPLFLGHVLVVPRSHYPTLVDLPSAEVGALFEDVQRIARAVEGGLGADGTFIAMNNRVSQSVPHLHVHVVPRRKKDGLRGFFWPRQANPDDAAMRGVADAIARAITSHG